MARDPSITVVAPTPFFTEGGCSYRVLGEVRAFLRAGRPSRVLTYPSGRDLPGVDIRRPRRSSRRMGIGMNPIRTVYDTELLRLLLRQGSSRSPWHVHLHEGAFLGGIVRALRDQRFVVDLEGSFVEEAGRTVPALAHGPVHRLARRFEGFLERTAGEVIVSSAGLYEAMTERGHLPRDRLHLVPDGVDVPLFTPRSASLSEEGRRWRRSLGFSDDDVVAVYIGGISPQQGIDDLLAQAPEMIREVPSLRFVVWGVAAQRFSLDRYLAEVERLGLEKHVRFPGGLPFEQVPSALEACDIGITWKTSALEGSGKIPLYMSAGIPTVASRIPAHLHYLGAAGERGGAIVKTPEEGAAALVALARDPGRRLQLGQTARRVAEQELSWDVAARRIFEIHARVGG